MPSLDKVRASYHRQMELLVEIKVELDRAMKDFTDGHTAGLFALRSGTGKFGSGGSTANVSDTTSQAGYEFHRLQSACSFASGLILGSEAKLRMSERSLERAGDAILNAWLDTDPDLGSECRAIRQAEVEITKAEVEVTQMTLTANHTDVIIPAAVSDDDALGRQPAFEGGRP
jgi:hypothetical protein